MVEVLESSTDTCVVTRFTGKVTGEEYKVFLDAVDDRLKSNDKINMVADLSDFSFFGDMAAIKEDARFGTREYKKISRAAIVGDKKWIEVFVALSKHLYKTEEKHFAAGELDEAIAWACQ